ncbi:condensation domain-containing protein, partial [Xanthomonas sacchari]
MNVLTPVFHHLFDIARFQASSPENAGRIAFTYIRDGEKSSEEVSFSELDSRAKSLAAKIQQLTNPGDRVLLVYPPSLDYIVAFYACVYAGVIAVPALPPASVRTLPRLRSIAEDCEPALAMTLAGIRQSMEEMQQVPQQEYARNDALGDTLSWLSTDDLAETDACTWVEPMTHADDIVFLQYTSGSTGRPKGVMVSHRNLLANVALIKQTYGVTADDTVVSWLPPHHDFGLIGTIIAPVVIGCHCVQFPPAAFLMRPHRWLKLISQYRARITGAPNFAYQLCTQRITEGQIEGVDLSCLEVIINGAERIRYETIKRFADAFSSCGLVPHAMKPSYGLAETVLLASASIEVRPGEVARFQKISKSALESGRVETGHKDADTIEAVSNGVACAGADHLLIVAPDSLKACQEKEIGEIWICGESVACGYWGADEASTREVFSAQLPGSDRSWLRTGDLGYLHDGHLYVTGRIKEMMIFNGRNVYPQDVEMTVERLDSAFRANGCAAFSVEEGQVTRLVIVQEVEGRRSPITETLVAKLRGELADRHDIVDLASVLLVKAGRIPRTSSGKIQRSRCRQAFAEGAFDCLWRWDSKSEAVGERWRGPTTSTEASLLHIWQQLLGRKEISIDDDFFSLGGHSLLASQLASHVRSTFNMQLSLRDLFASPTIVSLSAEIDKAALEPLQQLPMVVAGRRDRACPASFAQQRLWFLDQLQHSASAAYHLPIGMALHGSLDTQALTAALDVIVARHDALRTRFVEVDGEALQVVDPVTTGFLLQLRDISATSEVQRTASVRSIVAAEAAAPFDLANGPLIRGQLLRLSPTEHVLLVTQHHIVSDGWSIGVLLRELGALYTAFRLGQPDPLPPLALQYADYAVWQRQWLHGEVTARQLAFWKQHLEGAPALLELPTDRPRPPVQRHTGSRVALTVPAELTAGLRRFARQHQATLFMTVLAAWSALLARLSGQHEV